MVASPTRRVAGSSPLTRGKLLESRAFDVLSGLIPTHAGKTCRCPVSRPCWWAHPHSRGENDEARVFGEYNVGSSPLTRGKPRLKTRTRGPRRLIPTHAGKTDHPDLPESAAAAHPHSRGENFWRGTARPHVRGSSPLTRGKRLICHECGKAYRLIPTHAGKTRRATKRAQRLRAHPHSRGENVGHIGFPSRSEGSSPLTRGKRSHRPNASARNRLIPTHAGKTR